MRGDRFARMLSLIALTVALVAVVVAGRSLMIQRQQRLQIEALGELIRRSARTGQPVMDMGPPGGGAPELDRGD